MKPIIYRITHLWPNKQPGQGSTTAQIEEDQGRYEVYCIACGNTLSLAVPAAEDSTVQIKPETDELNALPSRFVSLQDYEAQQRAWKAEREAVIAVINIYGDGTLHGALDDAGLLRADQDYEALEREKA